MKPILLLALVAASITGGATAAAAPPAPKAMLSPFAGTWTGHTRELRISRDGRARESISSGCCDPVLHITFRLSEARRTGRFASVLATVTGVWVRDAAAYSQAHPPPHVGERRTLRLRKGVLTEALTGTTYCDGTAGSAGRCGA